jgi:hypothetical protein
MNPLAGLVAIGAAVALGSIRPWGKSEKAALGQMLKDKAKDILDDWPHGAQSLTGAGFTKEQAEEQLHAWLDKIPGSGRFYAGYLR